MSKSFFSVLIAIYCFLLLFSIGGNQVLAENELGTQTTNTFITFFIAVEDDNGGVFWVQGQTIGNTVISDSVDGFDYVTYSYWSVYINLDGTGFQTNSGYTVKYDENGVPEIVAEW